MATHVVHRTAQDMAARSGAEQARLERLDQGWATLRQQRSRIESNLLHALYRMELHRVSPIEAFVAPEQAEAELADALRTRLRDANREAYLSMGFPVGGTRWERTFNAGSTAIAAALVRLLPLHVRMHVLLPTAAVAGPVHYEAIRRLRALRSRELRRVPLGSDTPLARYAQERMLVLRMLLPNAELIRPNDHGAAGAEDDDDDEPPARRARLLPPSSP
jgi:hypothetical protein